MSGIFNMFEEELREYGTVEEKRRYIAEQRAADPNWVNTIFPPGKTRQGENWSAPDKGVPSFLKNSWRRQTQAQSRRNGAKPRNGRKARVH